MTEKSDATRQHSQASRANSALFLVTLSVVALVPLAFSTAVYRIYVLPKFAILLVGAALILCLLGLVAASSSDFLITLKSKHVALALFYVGAAGLSTLLGVSPLASLFGSYQSEMGLLSRLCFFVCFIGLIVAVGSNRQHLVILVWSIASTGSLVAIYAFVQFFGWDPFLPLSAYTMRLPSGPVVRVISSLGHSNYLGNFLLYTAPLTATLALAWRGRARRIALVGVAFSAAAIVFSGTRGAWLGLLAGAATLALLEARTPKDQGAKKGKRTILRAALASAGVLVFLLVIISSPASRDVTRRARSFVEDRFTGAGRLVLWRDAIRMVPRFVLIGCGPEAFSREFLAYKSLDLARQDPQINNESSHNSYLDTAISFGLPGAILYGALIASSFSLLLKARRRAADRRIALIITGLVASLAGIVVHNLFIYDQIPTGLYFFTFTALALAASNITGASHQAGEQPGPGVVSTSLRWTGRATAMLGATLLVANFWFAISLVKADVALRLAIVSARAGNFDALATYGERATHSLDPTGAYNFQFARALALYPDAISEREESGSLPVGSRLRAMETAIDQAQRSLKHTLTPDANYVLLAYLEFAKGDTEELRNYAHEAIGWDPYFFNARWLMAEALLAEGDREGAVREAQLALQLRPASSEARSVLARARGDAQLVNPRVQGLVERARSLLGRGNLEKAEDLLQRAIRDSGGRCPGCHRELALTYEKAQRYKNALEEWEIYARETPNSAEAQDVRSRIESLTKK
jgi:O-antigen ligase/tetratricopeptide (TPR) repeat protein